ncbi:MAG: M48 family metalloprotease [Pseudomonadales bacterium]|nr:M48 family metalloprotease [Pseudomonadales bacterium]MCP5172894.1 M48 family metalloprotease [Pseudomonadales bacterium]MCP5302368.1 M48 family metalloprotease [Pseudomonadales bacterium]
MFKPLHLLIVAALVSLTTACSVNPVTGKNEFSLVSAQDEVAIGAANYAPSQQSQGGRYYIDPNLQVYVAEIGRKLAAVSDRPGLPYEFVVLNNSVPNAWAMPGGKIAINRGLLIHLEDEAQLAAVLAHEIVHAAARHGAAQMTRGTLLSIGATALGAVGENYGLGQAGTTVAQLGAAVWMASYGREDELESDAYGMDYMARVGYDPYGAVQLQETFVQLNKNRSQDFISGLFASHPPSQERVAANLEKAKTLPRGNTYKDRYQRAIRQLKRDEPAYVAEVAAIKALNAKDPKTALAELDKAVALQPGEGYFWELRGHAWKMQGNPANAEKSFSTAIQKNPDYFSHPLARGLLRYKEGDKPGAQADLLRSYQILPTPIASYHLGELALANNDEAVAIHYFQGASNSNGELGEKARQKLSVLELASNPGKYILSKAFIDNTGYLNVAVKNTSAVAISNIRVQVTEMQNAFLAGPSETFVFNQSLNPGQQASFKTTIGPFKEAGAASQYRTAVVAVTQ